MKTEEDEAFEAIERKQGGFQAKRAMVADKLQDGKCKYCVEGCIACDARAQPAQEPYVRYCPDCGSIGSVPATARDCCPDGQHARMVPENFAKSCRETFMRAIGEAQPAQEQWNAALDEAAARIGKIKGFGQATQDSFAVYIKGLKK